MQSTQIKRLLSLLALATAAWCAAQQTQDQPLQMTVRQTSPNSIPQAVMHNAGKDPLTLCFRFSTQYVRSTQYTRREMDAIRLSLSDAYGEATALTAKHYVTIDPNPMGERRSFDRVILQPGEDHFFPIDFGYYKDEIGLPIAPGQYTLQAAYIEPPAPSDKLVANDPRRSCWTGSITAPPLPITIPEDSTQ